MKFYYILLLTLFSVSCSENNRIIKIKGSDTEVNLSVILAEEFYKYNTQFIVSISGGGSGLGIASLLNGQTDIANSSRPLSAEEIQMFEKKNVQYKTLVFAEDATAFVVHKSNPLDSINVSDLGKLLSGSYQNWQQVTSINNPVTIYGRQSNSGTHSFVQKKLNINFSRAAKEMSGNAQILESVKLDPTGIGYVGAGYLINGTSDGNIKPLKIISPENGIAISPLDNYAIENGLYFFQRPLYQFIRAESWQKVQSFLEFENGPEGKMLISKEGYYNIKPSVYNGN